MIRGFPCDAIIEVTRIFVCIRSHVASQFTARQHTTVQSSPRAMRLRARISTLIIWDFLVHGQVRRTYRLLVDKRAGVLQMPSQRTSDNKPFGTWASDMPLGEAMHSTKVLSAPVTGERSRTFDCQPIRRRDAQAPLLRRATVSGSCAEKDCTTASKNGTAKTRPSLRRIRCQ
jgi:hypothetical protein